MAENRRGVACASGLLAGYAAELCQLAGLTCSEISYCSGIVSQKITWFWRAMRALPGGAGMQWLLTSPFRLLSAVIPDEWMTRKLGLPLYSIALEAYKPRFESK